jgi:Protein of unknown function (DUF2950)
MKFLKLEKNRKESILRHVGRALGVLVLIPSFLSTMGVAATAQQRTFPSGEDAIKAVVTAAKANDNKELLSIFGPQAKDLIFSGDPVADKERRAEFLRAYDEKNSLLKERDSIIGDSIIVVIGKSDWPFPIPLVKRGDSWVFDTETGREEILNRRIGDNELYTIQGLLAIVDAEREYAMKDRDGSGLFQYAQKFRSEPGKKNGLYWEAKAGEEQSPLGPIIAQTQREGYTGRQQSSSQTAVPYHGYYYKILQAQGNGAPGGAYSYLVNGKMIGGFALVAYPAQYGNSGVMTFIVNRDGTMFEKDLGKNTATVAAAMKEYNPDPTWEKVRE